MTTCPICGYSYKYFNHSFLPGYLTCPGCTGHFIKDSKKIKVVYSESYFDEGKKYWISNILEVPLSFFLKLRVSYIDEVLNRHAKKILDYGCGSGKLVRALVSTGHDAVGFEPSVGALKIARSQQLPVFNRVVTTRGGYDLIMFWHSLEHTDDPLHVIKKVSKLLSKDGKILVAVPNADGWNAFFGGKKWFHYTYPLHKIHFNPKSIEILAKKSGLRIGKIDYFSPEYTLSGLVQTFLNFFLPMDILYSFVAHRRSTKSPTEMLFYFALSFFLIIVSFPFLFIVYLFELIFKKTDAMLIVLCK